MSTERDDAIRLLMVTVTKFRSLCASLAVLNSWCHELDTRHVRVCFDTLAQLRLAAFLISEPTPFHWPEHDVFSLVVELLHAKLDRTLVTSREHRFFDGTRLEVSFAVHLPDGEELFVLTPLMFSSADDKEQQICQNMGCSQAQPAVKLKVCARCHGAKYCSQEFQRVDWRNARMGCLGHKDHCDKLVEGGRWHPSHPAAFPEAIASRYPGVF
jgi:MYND finger